MSSLVTIDAVVLLPALLPIAAAVLILILDAAAPKPAAALALPLGLAATLAAVVPAFIAGLGVGTGRRTLCLTAPDGRCFYDPGTTGSLLQVAALVAAAVVLLLLRDELAERLQGGAVVTVALVLVTTTGAVTTAAAVDLGTWLIGLELATLPAVALVALRGSRAAAHGAMSVLTTALLSFGLLVVGAALWLVATGAPSFSGLAAQDAWSDASRRPALILAVVTMLAGLGFKVSAVPFHAWTPQAYAGATIPIAALLATISKIAAVAGLVAMLRGVVDLGGEQGFPHALALILGVLAAVTMTLGNVVALRQDDVVRLLAWSTIAQAGWVVLPLTALRVPGLEASVAYVAAYALASLVAFTVVVIVGRRLSAYRGLLRTSPVVGGALLLALASLAGLPPGIIGLVAKVVALKAVTGAGLVVLAAVAAVNAVIGVAVYLRWAAVLFGDGDVRHPAASGPTRLALALSTTLLIVLSAAPQIALGLLGA